MENLISNYSKFVWDIKKCKGIPFQYEDKDVKIFINGIIFNAEELHYRETAQKIGYYRSLANLWKIKGKIFFKELNGNYALFIYEKDKDILHVITDIIGSVPLYYYKEDLIVEFSFYPIEKKLNETYLPTLMFTRFIPSPATIWKKVYKIPPATILSFYSNRVEMDTYRSSFYVINYRDDRFIEKEMKKILEDTIEKYGMFEKVGIGISGGVDSALIGRICCEYCKILPVSVVFDNNDKDEKYINKICKILNVHPHIIKITRERFWEIWKEILRFPKLFVSPSVSLLYELYREFNREGIKYVISGHGADELFGGYPRYVWEKSLFFLSPLKYILKLPNFLRIPLTHRIRINLESLATYNSEKRIYAWMAGMTEDHVKEVFHNRVNWTLLSMADVYHDKLANMMYHDISGLLPDMLLENDYIASSLFNIRVLYPFSSPKMVELALSMPSSQRVNNMVTKYFIRRIANEYFPKCISLREQKGIKVPLKDWMREEPLKGVILDSLKDIEEIIGNIVKIREYKRMINDHINGWHDYSREIFMIYNLYEYLKRRGN